MFLRPQFSVLHNAESDYASTGPWAWLMVVSPAPWDIPPWRRAGLALRVLSWGALAPLVLLGHSRFGAHSLGGLYEKIFLAMELVWLFLVALPVAFDTKTLLMGNPDT